MHKLFPFAAALCICSAGCLETTAADGALKCASGGGAACPTGYYCAADNTCWRNGHTGSTTQASCTDGVKNGKETDIDCGGNCPACGDSKSCNVSADCTSALCKMSICVAPPAQCQNGNKDPGETDTDCGGTVCPACATGDTCSADSDCLSMHCISGVCVDQCADEKQDGDETDVDCGGSCANKCVAAQLCGLPADCASGTCSGGYCIAASGPPNWIKVADYPSGFVQFEGQTAAGPDGVIYSFGGCSGNPNSPSCGSPELVSSYTPSTQQFVTQFTSLPTGRSGGGAALAHDGKIYLFAGASATTGVDAIDAYDPITGQWSPAVGTITTASANGLTAVAMAVGASGEVYSIGGRQSLTNPGSFSAYGFIPSSTGGMVDPNVMAMPVSLYGAAGGSDQNGNIYVLLGACTLCAAPASGLVYNETTKTWAAYPTPVQAPTDRFDVGSATAGDNRIYVIGGETTGATPTPTTIVEAYTPKTSNWATVASLTTDRAAPGVAMGADGRIYALGGLGGSTSALVFRSTVEAYGPVFTLVSNKGAAGTKQGFTGSNFAANATVSVYFDTVATPVVTATTDATGQIAGTVTYTVPTVSAGTHRITAIDNKSSYPVYAGFTVQ